MSCCKYCTPNESNSSIILNDTVEYSGIEISMHPYGELRIRYYEENKENFAAQDIIMIKHCPMCGAALRRSLKR